MRLLRKLRISLISIAFDKFRWKFTAFQKRI